MTDYSKMSDFEINTAVAKLTLNYDELALVPLSGTPVVQWGDGSNWHQFDPCNSWADAGPIIQRNKLSIIWVHTEIPNHWDVGSPCHMKWSSSEYKPLRAAMIVFLMMNKGE